MLISNVREQTQTHQTHVQVRLALEVVLCRLYVCGVCIGRLTMLLTVCSLLSFPPRSASFAWRWSVSVSWSKPLAVACISFSFYRRTVGNCSFFQVLGLDIYIMFHLDRQTDRPRNRREQHANSHQTCSQLRSFVINLIQVVVYIKMSVNIE